MYCSSAALKKSNIFLIKIKYPKIHEDSGPLIRLCRIWRISFQNDIYSEYTAHMSAGYFSNLYGFYIRPVGYERTRITSFLGPALWPDAAPLLLPGCSLNFVSIRRFIVRPSSTLLCPILANRASFCEKSPRNILIRNEPIVLACGGERNYVVS